MAKESKYYHISDIGYSSSRWLPQLMKWNENYCVELYEDVEFSPHVYIWIDKLSNCGAAKPMSTVYKKVIPILKELFNDYYYLALKYINLTIIDEGEFYIIERSKDHFQVQYYSKNEKERLNLNIEFIDSFEFFDLTVNSIHGHRGRHIARRKGIPIEFEKFKQFLKLTLKFLSDHGSYVVFLEPYIKNFKNLVAGDNIIEGFDISSERAFKKILEQLEERKASIEKRLIEEDKDSLEDRIRYRGEIAGIDYAIKTIKILW